MDAVVSNPPYSQAWNPLDKESDVRYAAFGLAPKSKADYAFLLHDLYHLKPDGIMAIVLPHGVLFRGGEEGEIRKNLIERNHIDAIIGLPANIFFGTGIPTIIMVLRQSRPHTDVLIIDASKGFAKQGKDNVLRSRDIRKIADAVEARATVEKFSRVVSRDEIRANDYNLNIPRYVDSSEAGESWDIYASMFGGIPEKELDGFQAYWQAFPALKEALFRPLNAGYREAVARNLKEMVLAHPAIAVFLGKYQDAFATFAGLLKAKLVDRPETVNLLQAKNTFSADIFRRLEPIALVDPYEAYQLFDDSWKDIAVDLEILQTEGMQAAKTVDPSMVIKKSQGREQEVQEGWQGRIFPFELIQRVLLPDDLQALKEKEAQLAEFPALYEELLESLSQEDREKNFIKEDAFVFAEAKKAIKARELEKEALDILKKANALNDKEKALRKYIRDEGSALHQRTKEIIENLDDETVRDLLRRKWIEPLCENLLNLPQTIIAGFVSRLEALCRKYETTFSHLEEEIAETEKNLAAMIGELTGNDFDMQGMAELKKMLERQ